MNTSPNSTFWRTILTVALLYLLASLAQVTFNGRDEESVRVLIRYSARLSAVLFSLAFSAGAIHYFIKSTWSAWLLQLRPHLGLAFTVSHSFHLFFLIALQQLIHPVFTLAKTSSLLAGGTAYALMYLMAFTTFPKLRSLLNPRGWKMLHLIGGYWIWAVFFNSYLKNVLSRERYQLLLLMLTLVMILRVSQLIHQRILGRRRNS